MYFYDTNALLVTNDLDEKCPFCISSVTIQELEKIKENRLKTDEVRHQARRVSKWLLKNQEKYRCVLYRPSMTAFLEEADIEIYPDSKIIACAQSVRGEYDHFVFVTNDVNCNIIARDEFGMETLMTINFNEEIYKGYKTYTGNTDDINAFLGQEKFDDWFANEYLIIKNTDDGTEKEMRYDGERFVALKLPPSKYIKGRNALQRCALDMLANPEITICAVLGGYGSGKTALTMKMSIYEVVEKGHQAMINLVREPIGEGAEVGFLKGTFEEKTDQFFLPLVQQLDGGEFELNSLKQRGVIDAHIPYYCKGLTFNESIVVVDEAEDLDDKQIRLIGTRLGQNSRIFLNGDYKQSVIKASEDNALVKMCRELKGNPMFATIYLGEDVRSTTSKLFAHIFE